MKILKVRFKNLNSLAGEWEIDLTHPAFSAAGIFAITGPTGAGKTTILDAICLALYGRTPRLAKVTKSANEIMARQSGECFAEVVFETQTGRFRCHWSQHRARKKAKGELQPPKHEIAAADSGAIIETRIREVAGRVEMATGMDFERFTRSMLLAQGGFDTFLKADVEQKSSILEQITGTGIYSEISRRVHERQRAERDQLNLLQRETSGIMILTPEEEQQLQQELEQKQQQEAQLTAAAAETGTAIAWLNTIAALKKEIQSLAGEAAKLHIEVEAFKPERDRLESAQKAASLDGTYATLTTLRKQQGSDQAILQAEEQALPEMEALATAQAETLKSAEHLTRKAKDDLQEAVPLIQKVRSLDQNLVACGKAISDLAKNCTRDISTIAALRQARVKQQQMRIKAGKDLDRVAAYLSEHARDEWLISGLAGIEEQFANLLARQQEISVKEAALKHADAALAQATQQLERSTTECSLRRQELETVMQDLQQAKGTLSALLDGRLLREYRSEKEALLREMAYLRRIEELEAYRDRLEDGKPCPLCGSKEHPFAAGNVPLPDKVEQEISALSKLVSTAEAQEAAISKLETDEADIRKNLNESEKLETSVRGEKKAAEKTLVEIQGSVENLCNGFKDLKHAVSARLHPLGIVEVSAARIPGLLESLRSRLVAWQDQVRQKSEIEHHMAGIDSEMQRLDAVIETQSTVLAENQQRLKDLRQEYAVAETERARLYGDKNPQHEEARLHTAVTDAEAAEKKSGNLNTEMQQKLTTAKAHIERLKQRIEQREAELHDAETGFLAALEPAGFADEKHFLAARMPQQDLDNLSVRAKNLENAQTELSARQQDREARLGAQMDKKISDKDLEVLEAQFKQSEESLKALRDSIAGFKHRLSENDAAKQRIQEKQAGIEAQQKECQRWDMLHELIGSADGKKYRNFAQGLTFEIMVAHANRQLRKMSDRYVLLRDEVQALELNVIDIYQAGEIRSTKNLSGGESFIVSLALALGLSRMSSKNVRVDSLFLDEGFGSLDDDALDVALETLSGLQQDGKLIGIISHVPALKERIGTQIMVTPQAGGKSKLSGPGCGKIQK